MHYGFSKCFAVRGHTCVKREDERMFFSRGVPRGKRKTCQTKQWLPWRRQSSVRGSGPVVRVTWHADNR